MTTTPLPEHTRQANEALRAASNHTLDIVKQMNKARNTPLPEPAFPQHYNQATKDGVGGVHQDDFRVTAKRAYIMDDLRDYGAAEYQRGLEDAAKVAELWDPSRPIATKTPNLTITGRWEGEQAASVNIAAAIRKLGES